MIANTIHHFPDIAIPIHPEAGNGVNKVEVHPDLVVVESGRVLGNTDVRFGSVNEALNNRAHLAVVAGCKNFVSMVPQISDKFFDLDEGVITAPVNGYKLWPLDVQPQADYVYDPESAAQIVDLPTDGLITQTPGKGLMLSPADCAAVTLYDPVIKSLGLAHVGREGAVRDLGNKMIEYMKSVQGVSPENIVAYFGPSVAAESYILSTVPEVMRQDAWKPFLKPSKTGSGHETDFVGYAISRLIEIGVDGSNISRSTVDTFTDSDYFSHCAYSQGERDPGRNCSLTAIKPNDAAPSF